MKSALGWSGMLTVCVLAGWQSACAEQIHPLTVHLAQANAHSPYTLVRAKFEPGEVADPWTVRFFDQQDAEIPYFVWDSVTWQVAREGRPDWGRHYALLNHAPGSAPEVLDARGRKLQWAKTQRPELGAMLAAQDAAAKRSGDSVCAALYLLRHPVAAFDKERIKLRVYPNRQVQPRQQQWSSQNLQRPISVQQGELQFQNLPSQLSVVWKGRELFRYAGFDAGDMADAQGHVDPSRPFTVRAEKGIITKLSITSQTKGRRQSSMDWQCTYWLFPEGSYAALEGFSLGDTAGYIGGQQKLSIWQAAGEFTEVHDPLWEQPWWLHQVGIQGFVATHLFNSTPLTIGYGNNPFVVNVDNPPGRKPTVETDGNRLALRWSHSLDDLAISRLIAPELYFRMGHAYSSRPEDGRNWLDGNRKVVLAGTVENPPDWMTPESKRFVEDQLKLVRWQPMTDWLYRQYLVGVGEQAESAEAALRNVLTAAAGWIDRPFDEEELARLLVETAQTLSADSALKWSREMETVPCLLNPDPAGLKQVLARWPNEVAETDKYINLMQTHIRLGGNPIEGRTGKLDGIRGEGWIVNPSYHATCLPYYVRFLEHFDLPYPSQEYHEAILRFADFSLELLGGKPLDLAKLRKSYVSHWPSRFVAIIPLMLAANDLKPNQDYTRAAKLMFDVVMDMVERNPQGYWSAWVPEPKKLEPFDTVYNGAGTQRGLPAFWCDGELNLIGRGRAAHFIAAQARYLVFSGQFLDTLETDNVTAIYATKHGGHNAERKQIPLFLYDDFEFYRGLIGDLVRWSAANPSRAGGHGDMAGAAADRELGLAESGCYLLRWALGIGAGARKGVKSSETKWFQYKLDRRQDMGGFRLQVWNRLPWAKSTLSLDARDLGLKGGRSLLWLRLSEPAFRVPLEIDVTPETDRLHVNVSKPVRLRLNYSVLRPELSDAAAIALLLHRPDGSTQTITEGVNWGHGFVDWHTETAKYELRPVGR